MEMVLIFTFCLILAGTDAVTTVTGYRGRSVQIKCSYTSGYENNEKYLCRGKCPYVGYNDIPVKSGSPAKDSRFSLYDDTTAKVFTVTITDLRPEDKGTYWCVIERKGKNIYTEILLQVNTDAPALSTVSHITHTTHSTSTHSMSTSVHAGNRHPITANLLNNITHPTTAPSPQEIPTVITAVSVVLVLLLFSLLFAFVLQRKKKIQGSSPAQPAQSFSNRQVVPCPDYDYEENKNSRSFINTIYFTAPPPTNPCEIYSNIELPSTAPPLVMKSPESLTYAAVSFDTRANDAAPAVIYKQENNSYEYATVNINRHR
ncbi:CMRF35-like molecule 3 [Clarias gariepinus]|uniref:CMRF35-like molecule 3 n=1 Tax=Clarias gariepinus TaxID=13013 RepID=UPI00234E2793|nr:CMRF35-like molecule 3 [Clarias gariepinus]